MAIALENYASSGGSSGGGGSDPDGTTVINNDGSITFTYDGGVRTTTFSQSGSSKVITETDIPTGSATKTVKTTTITGNTIVQATTEVPVT